MASTKNHFPGDLIGTLRDYFRIGKSGVRLKNNAGVLEVRNAGDSADIKLKALTLELSNGSSNVGKVQRRRFGGSACLC
jgi:hypothetical protein